MNEIDEDDSTIEERIQELNLASISALVTVGLLASVMGRFPPEVQENFAEKVESLSILLREQAIEFQMFGESYDEEVDSES